MAEYTNDLRIKEIGIGEEAGAWGTTLNTQLGLLAEGFSYGVENLGSDANATITMANGASDEARSLYLKITSTSLSATRTVTLAPESVSKVWIIENATTGSQSITITQGGGQHGVTIPNGQVKIVYSTGDSESPSGVYDALDNLELGGAATAVTSVTAPLIEGSTSVQTPLIEYTDGDDAITIADGGGITAANGITSTAAANTFGATSFNDADITNVGTISLDSIVSDASPSVVTIGHLGSPAGNDTLVINGNVGIGETAPDRIFHVKRSDSAGTVAKFENSAGTVYIELNTDNQAGGDAGYLSYDSSKNLALWTDDTQQVTIDANGKVGIGATPDYKLHVFTSDSSASAHANADDLFIENSGNAGMTIGSGTSSNGSIFFSDSGSTLSGQIEYRHSDDSLMLITGATNRLHIKGDGDIDVINGNLIVANGHGIDFSATDNEGNVTSELFADYEEGNIEPSVTGSASGTYTLSSTGNSYAYTKIGQRVFISGYLTITGGSGTGQLRVSMPFTAAPMPDDQGSYFGSGLVQNNGSTITGQKYAFVSDAATYFDFYHVNDAGSAQGLPCGSLDTSFQIGFDFSFIAA